MHLAKDGHRRSVSHIDSGQNLRNGLERIARPGLSIKMEAERQYSKLVYGKLQKIEKALDGKFVHKNSLNEDMFIKCIFSEENKNENRSVRYSSSLKRIQSNLEKGRTDEKVKIPYVNIKEQDDDIRKLDKLSIMNVGARYELLNTNKLMIDLDLGLVFYLLTHRVSANCNRSMKYCSGKSAFLR
eukprot:TRINITY_DN7560_c0_g1_i4.p1 TRINITY_DN7560_c0_g1~~TRINITY_DN7560_c0_g1_i4.p1  ORF type:complete len:185 (-),score=15.28 TRINITY_DN7560_c0_g1_i4:188-742(-)